MDFKKFYEEQSDYKSFRQDKDKRDYYELAINWKKNNLLSCVSKTLQFDNILEVGCAFGQLLHILSNELQIKNVFGLDIANANIDLATKTYPQYTFTEGTLESFDVLKVLGKPRFELTILSDIVEHIPDDLDFMKKVNSISDYVLLNLPLEKSFISRNRQYGETDQSGHLRCYDIKSAYNLINQSNFEIVTAIDSNCFSYKPYRQYFIKSEMKRLKQKPFIKRIILVLFLRSMFTLGTIMPVVFKKYYGSNLFCLLKPKNAN